MTRKLAIVSGGLDSVTLAYSLYADNELGKIVSFDYGQRHKKELDFAFKASQRLSTNYQRVDISDLPIAYSKSALTTGVDVPEGHYAEDTMKATVVPNRNAIMLSIAVGIAQDEGLDGVAIAVHSGDHFIYPDCRPEFIQAFSAAMRLATLGFTSPEFHLDAPFMWITKADIVYAGSLVDVPFQDTWSCYQGGDIHCGACGTCFERREAFKLAHVPDPTQYDQKPDYPVPDSVKSGG